MGENENEIGLNELYDQNNSNQINALENILNALSELNYQLSSIKLNNTSKFSMSSIKTLKDILIDIKIP